MIKILKSINRDANTNNNNNVLGKNNVTIINNKSKAKSFCKNFTIIYTKPKVSKEEEKQYKLTKLKIRNCIENSNNNIESSSFALNELNTAIKSLKQRKACGADGIYDKELINSNDETKSVLLNSINPVWKSGCFPKIFINSVIVPVYKKRKPAKDPESYRPVALTSYLYELTDRLVINRLVYIIENK